MPTVTKPKTTKPTPIPFDKLPIAQQRVEIARDVIAQLDAKRLRATPGTYLSGMGRNDPIPFKLYESKPKMQVRDALAGRKCRVCGIGGLFVCAVDKADKLTLGEINDSPEFLDVGDSYLHRDYLGRWFKGQTLVEIESAFEGWNMLEHGTGEYDFEPFMRTVRSADQRLRIIADNIIRNRGRFVAAQIVKEYEG